MNYFSKIRIGTWVVIILTTINLATLGTIFFKHYKERSEEKKLPPSEKHNKGFKYMTQELNLTADQEKFFCESRKEFFDSSKRVFKAQEDLRIRMIKELSATNPDTSLLYKISEEMGQNYLILKRNTIAHLLKFREICTPEQRKKLDTIYHKIIRPEGPMGRHRKRPEGNKNMPEASSKPH